MKLWKKTIVIYGRTQEDVDFAAHDGVRVIKHGNGSTVKAYGLPSGEVETDDDHGFFRRRSDVGCGGIGRHGGQ